MTSFMFMLHDTTLSWVTLHWHDIGMTSSCSHHIHITCVMLSCLHHDIIAIVHESQLQSWCVTDRPLHDMQTFT